MKFIIPFEIAESEILLYLQVRKMSVKLNYLLTYAGPRFKH